RVRDHEVAVDEHRHEVLAAQLDHRRAVLGRHPLRLDLDSLVGERERDALDVGGALEAHEPQHQIASRWIATAGHGSDSASASTTYSAAVPSTICRCQTPSLPASAAWNSV